MIYLSDKPLEFRGKENRVGKNGKEFSLLRFDNEETAERVEYYANADISQSIEPILKKGSLYHVAIDIDSKYNSIKLVNIKMVK